jgi:hypothetical protein
MNDATVSASWPSWHSYLVLDWKGMTAQGLNPSTL